VSDSPLLIRNVTRAVHLVITGYGHWLPNDPRGSGSIKIRALKLKEHGPIHFGRKKLQPSRVELREFHRHAEAELKHPVLWFDEKMRDAIACGKASAARSTYDLGMRNSSKSRFTL